jgi:hypothetical protein
VAVLATGRKEVLISYRYKLIVIAFQHIQILPGCLNKVCVAFRKYCQGCEMFEFVTVLNKDTFSE